MGPKGQYMVDFFLATAQIGFLIGQTYFIASNLQNVLLEGFGTDVPIEWFCKHFRSLISSVLLCFLVTTPLGYVRRIGFFAFSYVIADVLIFSTALVILIFATRKVTQQGWGDGIEAFNGSTWLSMIGSAVYAYEGFGTILPVLDVAERPELFEKTLLLVLLTVFTLYTSFGVYCYLVYG